MHIQMPIMNVNIICHKPKLIITLIMKMGKGDLVIERERWVGRERRFKKNHDVVCACTDSLR